MQAVEKTGQKLAFGFYGTEIPASFEAIVRKYKIGNYILFRYNVQSAEQVRKLCSHLQSLAMEATGHPAFITIDQEGGLVSRMPFDAAVLPCAMSIAATGKTENAYFAAKATSRQLRGLGVNANLAPVLDVNSNRLNPIIGTRSFGDDPAEVSAYAKECIRGYLEDDMFCCGKHFPGHGDTDVDSHLGLPVINKSLPELERTELVPFRTAIEAGIPAIMSTHILFPQIDAGVPATMSRTIMHDLLRQKLHFSGLILSDCMIMNAIREHYGTAAGTVAAMKADVDIVFVCRDEQAQIETAEAVLKAAESGEIPDLDESVDRILKAKERYAFTNAEPEKCGKQEDFALAAKLSSEAICISGGEPFEPTENSFFCGCADTRGSQAAESDPRAVPMPSFLQRAFGGHGYVSSIDPDETEIQKILDMAQKADSISMSICDAGKWKGQIRLAQALRHTGKPVQYLIMRSPYDLPLLPADSPRILVWNYTIDAERAAEKVLRGAPCSGILPVKL